MYEIREIILKNHAIEKKRYVIEFTDPKKQIVGEFLMSDASLFRRELIDKIKAVLAGNKKFATFSGNRTVATVEKTCTLIEDLYKDVEGMNGYEPFEIDTEELLQLIDMWFETIERK